MRRSAGVAVTGLLVALSGCGSSDGSASAPSASSAASGATDPAKTITVSYPQVPPIRVPELSGEVDTGSTTSSAALAELAAPEVGVDLVSPACSRTGKIINAAPDVFTLTEVTDYVNLDGDRHVTLTTGKDGSKTYQDLSAGNHLSLTVNKDGSGTLSDLGGNKQLHLVVKKDGSGTLSDLGGNRQVNIAVNKDGSGTLSDLSGDKQLKITVDAAGHGEVVDLGGSNHLQVEIPGGGLGSMSDLGGSRQINVSVTAEQKTYTDLSGDKHLSLTVAADGAIDYSDQSGDSQLQLVVAQDGSGRYDDVANDVHFAFDSTGAATDSSGYRIVLPAAPTFYVDERIPKLGTLATLSPPCAKVLRFAADALFDFDKSDLKPSAQDLVKKAAQTLNTIGKPLQVNGYTDAKGTDEYNQGLSERRAAAFAAALKAAGVSVPITTTGYGEKNPVAPNTTPSGADDPAGRALNRRVEVVIPN